MGDRWKKQIHGAHTANMDLNRIAIGICLVGNFEENNEPTESQLKSLVHLIDYCSKRYNIQEPNIVNIVRFCKKAQRVPVRIFPTNNLSAR